MTSTKTTTLIRTLALPLLALSALAFITTPRAARADIPPPDGYVETCTVDKQQAPGTTCAACSAWHGDVEACDKTLGAQGMHRMCKSYGASAWSEVWCKGEATGPKPADETDPKPAETGDAKKSGCDASDGGELTLSVFGALFALARVLVGGGRRRARK